MYFSPQKRLSGTFPLYINSGESLTRSMEEVMRQCIPQTLTEYQLCPGLERLAMKASASFWMFTKNGPAQLNLTQNECAYPPCLIPTNCHSLPSPLPQTAPAPRYFEEGKWRMGFMTTGWGPTNFSFYLSSAWKDEMGTPSCKVIEQEGLRREFSLALEIWGWPNRLRPHILFFLQCRSYWYFNNLSIGLNDVKFFLGSASSKFLVYFCYSLRICD